MAVFFRLPSLPLVAGGNRGTAIESYRRPLRRGLPEESTRPTRLLSHLHFLRVSPLDATLMTSPASVANKRLTVELNPLDGTFTKNRGRGPPPVYPLPVPFLSLPTPSRPQHFDQRPQSCRKEPVPSASQITSHESPVMAHIPCPQQNSRLHPPSCILSPCYPPLSASGGSPFLLRRRPP